jgi:GNAT superfamily N-acetyltransferase
MPASTDTAFTFQLASAGQLPWVNARYAEIDFVPSPPSDLVMIASCGGERAGLGRVVPLAAGIGELGGMLVFDRFQGRGLAKAIIASLCALPGFSTLYCLPFAELEAMYAAMGFARVADDGTAPPPLSKKFRWCNQHYSKPVLLMRRT